MRNLLLVLALACLAAAEVKDKGWWKNTVFYQVFPRSFKDNAGDGIGDLQGIKEKIKSGYFDELGIGALILTPFYPSPLYDTGHDVELHTDVHQDYGTEDDFDKLIEEAHAKKMKIVVDFVPNHTSKNHYWFQKSQSRTGKFVNYYIWRDPKTGDNKPPNNWVNVFSKPAWSKPDNNSKYYLHQFSSYQPDLNFEYADVRYEMKNILRYWMDKKVDGFRVNAIDSIYEGNYTVNEDEKNGKEEIIHTQMKDDPRNYDLIKEWRTFLDERAARNNLTEQVLMTEANSNRSFVLKYYQYGSNVPLNFDLMSSLHKDSKAKDFQDAMKEWISLPANQTANWALGNHDKERLASRFPGKSDQIAMITMMLPGIVITYYGEEIGMVNGKTRKLKELTPEKAKDKKELEDIYKRDAYRTPFQWSNADGTAGFSTNKNDLWLDVNEDYKTKNYEAQKNDPKSHFNIYKGMIKLRKTPIVENGTTKIEILPNDNGNVLSVVRQLGEESVVLLSNLGDKEQSVDVGKYAPGAKSAEVNLASAGYTQADVAKSVSINKIVLPVNSTVILKMKNGAGFLMASINLVLATTLFVLFKIN